jgi:hypothetical protein
VRGTLPIQAEAGKEDGAERVGGTGRVMDLEEEEGMGMGTTVGGREV